MHVLFIKIYAFASFVRKEPTHTGPGSLLYEVKPDTSPGKLLPVPERGTVHTSDSLIEENFVRFIAQNAIPDRREDGNAFASAKHTNKTGSFSCATKNSNTESYFN